MAVTVPPLRSMSNVAIANAIRGEASNVYQQNVPKATKANVQQTLKDMFNYRPSRNEFVDALVNRIGMSIAESKLYTNPLAKFKRGMLQYGDTIEEIVVGLAEANSYEGNRDYLEKVLFGQAANEVQSAFHKINRQEFFKVTVNETLLQRAFLEANGLWSFTSQLINSAVNADELNEFLVTTSLFRQYYDNDGFFKINTPDIHKAGVTETEVKTFLKSVRAMAETLPFYSRHYNAAKMPVFANADELELFITPEAKATIDVDALAAAFNIDRADLPSRTTVIPRENFGIPNAQAILTTRDFFVISDTLLENTKTENAVGLYTNYFLHHHEVISASPFVPAILFTTEPGSVINIVESPVTSAKPLELANTAGVTVTKLTRGALHAVYSEAITTPTGGANNAVRYTIASKGGTLDPRTVVDQNGIVTIAISEESTLITITASTVDGTKSTSTDFPVIGVRSQVWPLSSNPDADEDNLLEVTPKPVTKSGATATIPKVKGVQYKAAGVDVDAGTFPLTASTLFTAVATAGYELATGAVATWTLAP